MKLGIIGTGNIVHDFLPQLSQGTGLTLTALQSTPRSLAKAQALCAQYGIPHAVQSFDDLAATGVDTVYVAVPNQLHYSYCRQALEKGLNVIVEKPMASTIEEVEALAALAQHKGLFLFEAITTLHLANYQKLREWLPRVGTVKLVQSNFCQYSSRYDAFCRGTVAPAFDPACSGGALMDLGLYNLHYVMGLFGTPNTAQYHPNLDRGIDTSGVLTLQYNGFQAVCLNAKDCGGTVGGSIQGTGGILRSALPANCVGKITFTGNDGTTESFDDGMAATRMLPEFMAFLAIINAQDHARCDALLAQSLAVSRVQTAARRAAQILFPADSQTGAL